MPPRSWSGSPFSWLRFSTPELLACERRLVDAALAGRHAGMFVAAGVICFIDPKGTFTALADILGFLFLLIGLWWMVRAFLKQSVNPLWWLG